MYGPRAAQVARTLEALVSHGWQSTVVCLDPKRGGPNWREGNEAVLPRCVDALRVKSPEEWTVVRALWRVMPWLRDRPDARWVWITRAAAAAQTAAARTRFDGLVTFAQPWSDHLVGLRVHRATKLPWVAHFSDPWVDDPYRTLSPARRAEWQRMESNVVGDASAVVFVSQETADLVMAKYPAAWRTKAAVVPHGFVGPIRAHDAPPRHGPMRLVHTGRFYDGLRTPMPLLKALAELNSTERLEGAVEVTLAGPHTVGYAAQVDAFGLRGVVRLLDRMPNQEAVSLAAAADLLLVIDAPTAGPSPYLPSKLVEYLPLRKPIFGITPSEGASASLLRRLGAPIAAPDDDAGIRIALRDLLSRWREGGLAVGPEFDGVAAEYDIRRTTALFSGVLTRAFA